MKYLKTKALSKWSTSDRTLIAYPSGVGPGNRVVLNANGGLMLPKGTTAERPQLTSVRQPTDANGTIRYNTSNSTIEAYVGGTWVTVASSLASAITKQTIGPGDGTELLFGPLNTTFAPAYSASADNIIVLIENVMQISTTNFTIVQNPAGTPSAGFYGGAPTYPTGYYIQFTSPVPASGSGGNPVYVTVYYGYAN
jgi:hypothetical protein